MSNTKKSPRATFTNLPYELKAAIFTAASDDFDSVYSLAHSSASLHALFKAEERRLLHEHLHRRIPKPVLNEALACWEARNDRGKFWSASETQKFFARYADRAARSTLTRAKVSGVVALHEKVAEMATNMADPILWASTYSYTGRRTSEKPREVEMYRFQRAFYRLELWFIFFGDPWTRDEMPGEGQREAFWDYFAPWEIEQISCVSEYLEVEFHKALMAKALADKEFLCYVYRSHGLDIQFDTYIPRRMAVGMDYIHGILTGRTSIVASHEAMRVPSETYDGGTIICSLRYAMKLPDNRDCRTLADFERMYPSVFQRMSRPAFTADQDDGPEISWRWAVENKPLDEFGGNGLVSDDGQLILRESAYVFWDRKRIDEWRVRDLPWTGDREAGSRRLDRQYKAATDIARKVGELARLGMLRPSDMRRTWAALTWSGQHNW